MLKLTAVSKKALKIFKKIRNWWNFCQKYEMFAIIEKQ